MLSDGRGFLNACQSLELVLKSQLPAKVTANNALTSATVHSGLAGSYVVAAGGKTLILYRNASESGLTVTVAAGTYTATQMAAALNATSAFNAIYTATTRLNGSILEIYDSTRGTAGSIKIGAGTINSVLGLVEGRVYNYIPLDNIAWSKIQHDNLDDVIPAYPALTFFPESREIDPDLDLQEYQITIRLWDLFLLDSGAATELILDKLGRMGEQIIDVLHAAANASLGLTNDGIRVTQERPGKSLMIQQEGSSLIKAYSDFSVQITTQESPA